MFLAALRSPCIEGLYRVCRAGHLSHFHRVGKELVEVALAPHPRLLYLGAFRVSLLPEVVEGGKSLVLVGGGVDGAKAAADSGCGR